MKNNRLEEVMGLYQSRYNDTLERIKPAINNNGFAEQNQTVNFISAYESVARDNKEIVSSWYEFQIPHGERSNNRIDGIVLNHSAKEIYLIEAKRFSKNKVKKKKAELIKDYHRIMQLDKAKRLTEALKGGNASEYRIYGILLFDIWTENNAEKQLYHKWSEFCDLKNPSCMSFAKALDADDLKNVNGEGFPMIKEITAVRGNGFSYYLCAFVWNTEYKNGKQ